MKRHLLIAFVMTAGLQACEKEELPKPYGAAPSASTVQVSMGGDYANQLFFDLAAVQVVSQNNREIWDLAFESSADGIRIRLNSSKFMAVSKTAQTDLGMVTASTPVSWSYDNAAGKEDSLAFYGWEPGKVYIIDRGNTVAGQPIGKLKMQVVSTDADSWTIRWGATLNATEFETRELQKSAAHDFIYFSFTSGQQVNVAPAKDAWDLCFTAYTYLFHDGTPYLVTGVLASTYGVETAESSQSFDDVSYADAVSADYAADLDLIGYDWKYYDFDLGTYTVQSNRVFLIRSVQSRYYKLRFIDFYDANGVKGAPTMEIKELVP